MSSYRSTMARRRWVWGPWIAALAALWACRATPISGGSAPADSPTTTAAPAPATGTPTPANPNAIAWRGPIRWQTWQQGRAEAQRLGKPLCLVVYADWCPHCHELAPVFSRPDVAAQARGLVMVHQNDDEHPAWLTGQLGRYGQYVPRILFLSSTGRVMTQLTSGNPRYPYFYTPRTADRLMANMHTAAGG